MYIRGIGNYKVKMPDYEDDFSFFGRGKTIYDVALNSSKYVSNYKKPSDIELNTKYFEGLREGYISQDFAVLEKGDMKPFFKEKISDLYDYEPLQNLADQYRLKDIDERQEFNKYHAKMKDEKETGGKVRRALKNTIADNIMSVDINNPTSITLTDDFTMINRNALKAYQYDTREILENIRDLRTNAIPSELLTSDYYSDFRMFLAPPEFLPKTPSIHETLAEKWSNKHIPEDLQESINRKYMKGVKLFEGKGKEMIDSLPGLLLDESFFDEGIEDDPIKLKDTQNKIKEVKKLQDIEKNINTANSNLKKKTNKHKQAVETYKEAIKEDQGATEKYKEAVNDVSNKKQGKWDAIMKEKELERKLEELKKKEKKKKEELEKTLKDQNNKEIELLKDFKIKDDKLEELKLKEFTLKNIKQDFDFYEHENINELKESLDNLKQKEIENLSILEAKYPDVEKYLNKTTDEQNDYINSLPEQEANDLLDKIDIYANEYNEIRSNYKTEKEKLEKDYEQGKEIRYENFKNNEFKKQPKTKKQKLEEEFEKRKERNQNKKPIDPKTEEIKKYNNFLNEIYTKRLGPATSNEVGDYINNTDISIGNGPEKFEKVMSGILRGNTMGVKTLNSLLKSDGTPNERLKINKIAKVIIGYDEEGYLKLIKDEIDRKQKIINETPYQSPKKKAGSKVNQKQKGGSQNGKNKDNIPPWKKSNTNKNDTSNLNESNNVTPPWKK
jgi:hypothetical protein